MSLSEFVRSHFDSYRKRKVRLSGRERGETQVPNASTYDIEPVVVVTERVLRQKGQGDFHSVPSASFGFGWCRLRRRNITTFPYSGPSSEVRSGCVMSSPIPSLLVHCPDSSCFAACFVSLPRAYTAIFSYSGSSPPSSHGW